MSGSGHTCFLRADGKQYCWGQNFSNRPEETGLVDALGFDGSGKGGCAVLANQHVVCWGGYWYGSDPSLPVEIAGVTDAVGVVYVDNAVCIRRADASVVCQLNDNSPLVTFPKVGAVSTFDATGYFDMRKDVFDGVPSFELCFVRATNGSIGCVSSESADAVDVPGVTGAKELYVQNQSVLRFIGATNQLSVYDDDTFKGGVPGLRADPNHVGTLAKRADRYGDCVLTPTGTVECVAMKKVPAGIKDVVEVAPGDEHVCVLTKNEKVFCWGKNTYGQLGAASYLEFDGAVEALVP